MSVTTSPAPVTTLPYPGSPSGDLIVDNTGQLIEATSPAQVYFINHEHGGHHHHPAPKPPEEIERDLTGEELRVAARRAIEGFADFWKRETVERLLKEAQLELINAPVPDPRDLALRRALGPRAAKPPRGPRVETVSAPNEAEVVMKPVVDAGEPTEATLLAKSS